MLKLLLQFVPGLGPLLSDVWTLLSCPTTWIAIGAVVAFVQHEEIGQLRTALATEKQAYTLEKQAYDTLEKRGLLDANKQVTICEQRVVTARQSATYTANLLSEPTNAPSPAGDPQLLTADELRKSTGR